jgi:hypothetical protein
LYRQGDPGPFRVAIIPDVYNIDRTIGTDYFGEAIELSCRSRKNGTRINRFTILYTPANGGIFLKPQAAGPERSIQSIGTMTRSSRLLDSMGNI